MESLDSHLVYKIKYEFLQNPKKTYDSIISYMKSEFRNTCSGKCKFRHFHVLEGKIQYKIMLVRQTHADCSICKNSVSEYSHRFCYKCSPCNTIEYLYHHRRCSP